MKMCMKTRIAMCVMTLGLTAVAGLVQAAETRFAVQDAAGTTDKMVVQDTGYIGVGTNTPAVGVHVKGTAAAQMRAQTNMASGAAGGSFVMMHNNGSNTSLPILNDRIGAMYFGTEAINPSTGTPAPYYGAGITIRADGPWQFDSVNPALLLAPTYISIDTGSATAGRAERVKIASTGNVGIGTFGGANPTQKLEVKGGVRVNSTGAKPACDATSRGTFWVTQNVGATLDVVEVCVRLGADNNYLWKALF